MKSELTLEIENALKTYEANANKARGRNLAFEVPVVNGTPHGGLIDAVEVTELTRTVDTNLRTCNWAWKGKGVSFSEIGIGCLLGRDYGLDGCDRTDCKCNGINYVYKDVVRIYCYEIKVSRSDFYSKNGHNFIGNENYYIMPAELYSKIKEIIPADIGVIVYINTEKYKGLRRKKDAEYKDIGDEAQKWLILSVFKRMRKEGNL